MSRPWRECNTSVGSAQCEAVKAHMSGVAIYATRKKLTPPSYAEGFDKP